MLPPLAQQSSDGTYRILYPDGRIVDADQDWNGRIVKPSEDPMGYIPMEEAADSIRFCILNGLPMDPLDLFWYGKGRGLPGPSTPEDVNRFVENGRRFD